MELVFCNVCLCLTQHFLTDTGKSCLARASKKQFWAIVCTSGAKWYRTTYSWQHFNFNNTLAARLPHHKASCSLCDSLGFVIDVFILCRHFDSHQNFIPRFNSTCRSFTNNTTVKLPNDTLSFPQLLCIHDRHSC